MQRLLDPSKGSWSVIKLDLCTLEKHAVTKLKHRDRSRPIGLGRRLVDCDARAKAKHAHMQMSAPGRGSRDVHDPRGSTGHQLFSGFLYFNLPIHLHYFLKIFPFSVGPSYHMRVLKEIQNFCKTCRRCRLPEWNRGLAAGTGTVTGKSCSFYSQSEFSTLESTWSTSFLVVLHFFAGGGAM